MPFLKINELEVEAMVDQVGLQRVNIESFTRSIDDTLQGRTFSELSEYTFTTNPLTQDTADRLAKWLEGESFRWNFAYNTSYLGTATIEFTRTENQGGPAFSAGNSSASIQWAGGSMSLGSGVESNVVIPIPDPQNYTFAYWQAPLSGNKTSCIIRMSSGTLEPFRDGGSVSTIYSFREGGDTLTIRGTTPALNIGAASAFGGVVFLPFAATAEMISTLVAQDGYLDTDSPFIQAEGDFFTNRPDRKRSLKCFVSSEEVDPLVLRDGFEYNARQLTVKMVER